MIRLRQNIRPAAIAGLALPRRLRLHGHVGLGIGDEQEEGLFRFGLSAHVLDGFFRDFPIDDEALCTVVDGNLLGFAATAPFAIMTSRITSISSAGSTRPSTMARKRSSQLLRSSEEKSSRTSRKPVAS